MTSDLLIAVAAATAVFVVLVAPPKVIVTVLVASTFVTRFRIHVLGHHFLVEHLFIVLAIPSLLLHGWGSRLLAAAVRPASLLFLCYIIWGIVTSLLLAQQVGASLAIAVWLLLSWLILIVALAWFADSLSLEILATRWAAWAAVLAVLFWALSVSVGFSYGTAAVTGLPTISGGAASGGLAAYGLSYEPNLLGSTMAIWVFLALTRAGWSRNDRLRMIVVSAGSVALFLSLSRAPLFGLVLGLAVWGGLARGWARRRVISVFGAAALVVAVIAVVSPQTLTPLVAKIANSTNLQSGSGGARYTKAQQAVADLSGHWVGGLGLDSFSQRHLEVTQRDEAAYLPTLPLQIVYDTGLIGVLLIVFALAALRPFDGRVTGRRARASGLIVVYGISSLATSPFWFGSSWLLIALAVLSAPVTDPVTDPVAFASRRVGIPARSPSA
jgi:hypothetical protein